MHSHTDAVSTRESLNSQKQKRLSPKSPALEFVHLLQEKKCYSLYAATSELDRFEFNVVCSPIGAKPSPDCLNKHNPSTDHLRIAVQGCFKALPV